MSQRPVPSSEGRRIVICDYNALLLSVTGLLRMSGYCVFQAHDGQAARELCVGLPTISPVSRRQPERMKAERREAALTREFGL
jgi:hypothetical protein